MSLTDYLITGSYIWGTGAYLLGYKILQALNRIEQQLEHARGLVEGQDLDRRVTRLERERVL